jgi:hypothetical protein
MQSLEASKNYKNSFVCAARIFKDEGITTLWSGAVPRLARLIMSGGIVFTMFVYTRFRYHLQARQLAKYKLTGTRKLWTLWTPSIRKDNTYDVEKGTRGSN